MLRQARTLSLVSITKKCKLARAICLALGSLLVFAIFTLTTLPAKTNSDQAQTKQVVGPWTSLVPTELIGYEKKIPFFKLQTDNGSAAYLAVIDSNNELRIEPFFNLKTATVSDTARAHNALVAINGGFFNLSDTKSASYVVVNGLSSCESKNNKALVENPKLKPYLASIFNRSELRILKNDSGKLKLEICKHFEPVPASYHLVGSLQAGPQLLPKLTDKEEAFVRTNDDGTLTDSIGSHRHTARTACGITPDGHLLMVCVASKGQAEFSSGVTLLELAEIMRQLGCDRALNFDGGTSTTMAICTRSDTSNSADKSCQVKHVCGKLPEKMVKSGLLIRTSEN